MVAGLGGGKSFPYRVVAEPQLQHFADKTDPQKAYEREFALAAATGRRLTLDVLTGLPPWEIQRMAETRIVLLRTVRAVGGSPSAHPGIVITALHQDQSEHRGSGARGQVFRSRRLAAGHPSQTSSKLQADAFSTDGETETAVAATCPHAR